MLTAEPCWACGGNGGSFTPRGCTDWCAEVREIVRYINRTENQGGRAPVERAGRVTPQRLVP